MISALDHKPLLTLSGQTQSHLDFVLMPSKTLLKVT